MPLDEYQLIQFALKVGAAILVFLVGRWLARRARKTLGVALAKTTIPPSMARLLLLAAYYVHHADRADRRAGHRRFPGHRPC